MLVREWRRGQDSNLQGLSPGGFQDRFLTIRVPLQPAGSSIRSVIAHFKKRLIDKAESAEFLAVGALDESYAFSSVGISPTRVILFFISGERFKRNAC